MSIETKCTNCGEEHDLRHDGCPACTITIQMRRDRPPYDTFEAKGYVPFEVHGEKFVATRIPGALAREMQWRATHVATGAGVPKTDCRFMDEVPSKAREVLESVGPEKLRKSLAKVAALLANTEGQTRSGEKNNAASVYTHAEN